MSRSSTNRSQDHRFPQPKDRGRKLRCHPQWAVAEAFEFHQALGRQRIASRIMVLNSLLKHGLASMRHVKLWTPRSPALSAGLVGFDVAEIDAQTVRDRLWQQKVVATGSPYARGVARLSAGIMNNEQDVEKALQAVDNLSA